MYPLPSPTRSGPLRRCRQACHISQEQAAEYLRISRQSYGAYERGERPMPPGLLLRCASLYQVSPEVLEDETDGRFARTKEEQDLLHGFRLLPEDSRQQILSLIYYEIGSPD